MIDTIEWRRDPSTRKRWGSGPWDGEPDKKQWPDPATGMDCLAVRNAMGSWCGYVGVPVGHPWHGKGKDGVDVGGVHGGLTFADVCHPSERPGYGICHEAAEEVWWFGFDCEHYMDASPGLMSNGAYRTLAYVQHECAELARQLKEAT